MDREGEPGPPRPSDPTVADEADAAVAALAELSREFTLDLPHKLEEMAAACRDLGNEPEAAKRAQRIAHGLAGAGTTFGMPEISALARELEILLRDIVQHGAERGKLLGATTQRMVADLRRAATGAASHRPTESKSNAPGRFRGAPLTATQVVGVLDTDPPQAHGIAAQLVHFGYEVRVIPAGEVVDAKHLRGLSALLCELDSAESVRRFAPGLPLVCMLDRDDLALRLQAVRAGFSALVARPCDAGELARALERLNPLELAPSERVLIVDDDTRLARSYAITLENAGMIVSVLEDPMRLLDKVVEFRPEIVLMDLYLPDCTGLELAAVLRQDDRVVGVPIVFLTAETRPTSALAALEVGADDFLSKPVAPERLVSVVRSRIDRARIVRSFMDRDSLTGLLNHSRTLERVEQELMLARRRGSPFSLVVIDLDHFKRVND
ncbi:MAG TPA: response regulator, partial [Polyangiaceae bacterium]